MYEGRLACLRDHRNCHLVASHRFCRAFAATCKGPSPAMTTLGSWSICRDGFGSLSVSHRSPQTAHRSFLSCFHQPKYSTFNDVKAYFSWTISHHFKHLSSKGTTRFWPSGVDPSSAGSFPSFMVAWISKSCDLRCSRSFSENYRGRQRVMQAERRRSYFAPCIQSSSTSQ